MPRRRPFDSIGFAAMALFLTVGLAVGNDDAPNTSMLCGPHCLWLACKTLGKDVSLSEIARAAKTTDLHGTSVRNMLSAADALGVTGQVVRADLDALRKDRRCAIAIMDNSSHFAFIQKIDASHVVLIEELKARRMPRDVFMQRWGHLAIMVGTDEMAMTGASRAWIGWGCLATSGTLGLIVLIWKMSSRRRQVLNS